MRERRVEVEIPNPLEERAAGAASDCWDSMMASAAWSLLGRIVSGVYSGVNGSCVLHLYSSTTS